VSKRKKKPQRGYFLRKKMFKTPQLMRITESFWVFPSMWWRSIKVYYFPSFWKKSIAGEEEDKEDQLSYFVYCLASFSGKSVASRVWSFFLPFSSVGEYLGGGCSCAQSRKLTYLLLKVVAFMIRAEGELATCITLFWILQMPKCREKSRFMGRD